MKRAISFLLVLVMLLGILPMAAFAEETEAVLPQVTLTADKETVKAGEDITLTLSLSEDLSKNVAYWQWDFVWDSTYFTAKEGKVGDAPQPRSDEEDDAITPLLRLDASTYYTAPYTAASVTSGNAIVTHKLTQGTIATLTLTAKEDITGDVTAKFFMDYILLANSKNQELTIVTNDPAVEWGTDTQQLPADSVGLPVTVTPKAAAPTSIKITAYYAAKGTIATGKEGTLLNFAPVTVEDLNEDGMFTVQEGFIAMHKAYCEAGEDGYLGETWVNKFWGITDSNCGYVHNNRWIYSPQEEIAEGDSIAFFYYVDSDPDNWANAYSDLYTYFDNLKGTATANQEASFHVNGYSVFGSGKVNGVVAHAVAAPAGATVTATCGDKTLETNVDTNGDFKLTFPAAGEWTVLVNGTCSYTCDAGYYPGRTYTGAPVVPAMMTVTVTDGEGETNPDPTPTTNGYTVTLDEKKEVTMDEIVSIDVKVGHTDETVTTYNAFDMTFSYDSNVLNLDSTAIEGLTVIPGEGTVRVQGYGPDREIGSTAFTLTFRAKTTGNTAVKVTTPKVDRSASAIKADAPEAVKTVDTTNVTIGGYPVNLPEDFTGATVVEPNTDYTFKANDKNYNYTFEGTTMGEEKVEVIDNGDGTFTIKNVSGKINVVSEKTPKSFKVTLGTDMKGDENAQYMTDYEATLTEDNAHYTYNVSVTIGGETYTGYGVSEGKYTIPGKDITGDIVFTVTKTPIPDTSFKVSFEGNGAGDAEGSNAVAPNASYSFKLNKETGYKYDVTAKMGSSDASFSEDNGTYTFAQVTGDLVITITKTLDVTVTVHNFVELDGKTVFLVAANATLGEGKALTYNGTTMFYSDGSDSTEDTSTGYNAWCYLVIVEENTTFTAAEATANIGVATSAYTTLADTKDVNESGKVDINDAQLVYDIYNHKYVNFDTVSMQKFLKADVNHDRTVNVTDAAAVVTAIE